MTRTEWTCGHVADAMCAECYQQLARRASGLGNDNLEMIGVLAEITTALEQIADIAEGNRTVNSLPHIARIARAARAKAIP